MNDYSVIILCNLKSQLQKKLKIGHILFSLRKGKVRVYLCPCYHRENKMAKCILISGKIVRTRVMRVQYRKLRTS